MAECTSDAIRQFGAVVRRIPGWEVSMSLAEMSYTPTQLRLARERRERLQRFAASAVDLKRKTEATVAAVTEADLNPVKRKYRRRLSIKEITESWLARNPGFAGRAEPAEPPSVRAPIVLVNDVIDAVCEFYDVLYIDLISHRREAAIVRPRHVAGFLAKTLTTASYPHIAKHFGGRDHTTQLHAYQKIRRLLAEGDRELADEIEFIGQGLLAMAS